MVLRLLRLSDFSSFGLVLFDAQATPKGLKVIFYFGVS